MSLADESVHELGQLLDSFTPQARAEILEEVLQLDHGGHPKAVVRAIARAQERAAGSTRRSDPVACARIAWGLAAEADDAEPGWTAQDLDGIARLQLDLQAKPDVLYPRLFSDPQ